MKERERQQARMLAARIEVPNWAAGNFSLDMFTVLGAIRDEADKRGRCTATAVQLAERTGVSKWTAYAAVKRAKHLGLIAIEDIPGGKYVIVNRHIRRSSRGDGQFD
jgi:hypothetical protein